MATRVEGLKELEARFKRLRANVRARQERQLLADAEELAGKIKAAAPLGDDGQHELADSVRVIQKAPLKVLVVTGGAPTTRPVKDGQSSSYDYARAQEFGTAETPGHAFHHPTARRYKKTHRRKMAAAARKAIKEGLA